MTYVAVAQNISLTEPITLVSAELIDAVGLELVDSFTVDIYHQLPPGLPSPLEPRDVEGLGSETDYIANWASRIPLEGSVIPPDDDLQMVMIVRFTTTDPCAYTKGFKLKYQQAGRQYSVRSNWALVVYSGDDRSVCDAAREYLSDNPI